MKDETWLRERYHTLMEELKKLDIKHEGSSYKMLAISAVLREIDTILED